MSSGMPTSLLLQMLLISSPILLANGIGVMVASVMLTRYPRPAKLLLAGCGINLVASGLSHVVRGLIPTLLSGTGVSVQSLFVVSGVVSSVMYAAGLGLIITAVFVDRTHPQLPPEDA